MIYLPYLYCLHYLCKVEMVEGRRNGGQISDLDIDLLVSYRNSLTNPSNPSCTSYPIAGHIKRSMRFTKKRLINPAYIISVDAYQEIFHARIFRFDNRLIYPGSGLSRIPIVWKDLSNGFSIFHRQSQPGC